MKRQQIIKPRRAQPDRASGKVFVAIICDGWWLRATASDISVGTRRLLKARLLSRFPAKALPGLCRLPCITRHFTWS